MMYTGEQALKDLYQADSIEKHFIADFYSPGSDTPFLSIIDGRRFFDMTLEESLSSGENIDFGSCEASQLKMTLIDVDNSIKGAEMVVYQVMDGVYPAEDLYPGDDVYPSGYTMPFGRYVIQSADRQANQSYRDIVALDYMSKFDVNVIDWYNALAFPLTLKDFRASLCRYIGVTEHVPDYLPHESVLIEKTIDTATLMGRDVLIACEQLNGVFGHFDRNGVLQHITLQPNYTLMPATDLYPSEDLYPVLPGELNEQVYDERIHRKLYLDCEFEEHTVQSIDKVQIRQEEGDIGAIYGTGENCLTVEGNFLVYGKSAEELNSIAGGIYGMVSRRQYIPYSCNLKGLPYIEVGDTELIEAEQGDIVTYVIQRTLKGIYGLRDAHSATGEEIRSTESNINTEIIQLKGKAAILKKNVEEVSAHLIDFEAATEAKFTITAEQIAAEVKRAQEAEAAIIVTADQISLTVKNLTEYTESQFIQTANQIALKVSKGDVSSQLSVETDKITLSSNRLIVNSTNFQLDGNGNATFSGKIVGGSINIGGGTFVVSDKGVVTINSGSIRIGPFEVDNDEVWLGDYYVSSDGTNVFRSGDESVVIQTKSGGPFGKYPAIVLSESSTETILSGHHLDISHVNATEIDATTGNFTWGYFKEVYPEGSWWKGWSLTDVCRDLWDEVFNGSDETLKQNIKPLPSAVAKWIIQNTNVKQWLWREDKSHDMGVIAQELQETLKGYGIDYKFVDMDDRKGTYYVDYRKYIPLLIMAVQDLYDKIDGT